MANDALLSYVGTTLVVIASVVLALGFALGLIVGKFL